MLRAVRDIVNELSAEHKNSDKSPPKGYNFVNNDKSNQMKPSKRYEPTMFDIVETRRETFESERIESTPQIVMPRKRSSKKSRSRSRNKL